jgi:TolB-like protein/tetratricopeptide (TPR) repeat protein
VTDLRERIQAGLADRYRLERELGRGGMATVFLAHDLRHDRPVALKVLHPQLALTLGPERFQREIKLAARLQHPHILSIHDSGQTAGRLWFTMPFVEGESLRDRLNRDKQLPLADALRITIDTARALDYAHEHGVVHRDIKPENLLLAKDGSTLVADFGIARALDSGEGEWLTEAGLAVGTPLYMSPEQGAGDRSLDRRSDVYSLACVLYEMLSGEPPFRAETPQGMLAKHLHAPVPKVRVLRPGLPPDLEGVLETALAKVPADRFGSAGEFARAAEVSGSSAIAARRRWPRWAAVWGSIVVMVAVGVLVIHEGATDLKQGRKALGTAPKTPRIAVLYFDEQPPDSTLRLFADGLTEELIHELSGVNAFRVISRNGVRPYRGRQAPFDSMVAALGATTVIDGSVQRAGDRVQVTAQLIDALSGTYLDSISLERPKSDFIGLERQVALQVAAALRREMGRDVRLRGTMSGTVSERARTLMLKAQRARDDAGALSAQPSPEDLRTAVETLRRADSLLALAQVADPRWLRPLIDRGWVAHDRSSLLSGIAHSTAVKDAQRLADEAVRRAPESAEALELRGTLAWELVTEEQGAPSDTSRLHRAEVDLRGALDRDSTLARAWATLSYLLWYKGSTAEAEMAARRALREDAYLTDAQPIFNQLFFADLMLGKFQQAAEWCRRGRLSFPDQWRFVECQLTLMRHNTNSTPHPDSAWALVRELDRLDPADKAAAEGRAYHTIYRRVVAATISARAGRRDIARAELARAIQAAAGDSTLRLDLIYDEAYLRLVLGQQERAAELLRKYIKARPMARDYIARDPLFKDLRRLGG